MMKKAVLLALTVCIHLALAAQTAADDSCFQAWNKPYATAEEIVKSYKAASHASVVNDCGMIWQAGNYIMNGKGEQQDISLLLASFPEVDINSAPVLSFMQRKGVGVKFFINDYFLLQGMKKGRTFDEARDGLSFSTIFPLRAPSASDYEKLHYVFSTKNLTLQRPFLNLLEYVMMNNGCTDGLSSIRPLIEQNVADGQLKQRALAVFDKYEPLKAGHTAPLSELKSLDGKTSTFAKYKGKTIVVDVWATWCSSCLKKMPHFVELAKSYAHRKDVVFVLLSTDRNKAVDKYKSIMEKYADAPVKVLRADVEGGSSFEIDYNILGLPRYIVIDRKGKIANAFAPSPDKDLQQLVEETLKK